MTLSDNDERFMHLLLAATQLETLGRYDEAEEIWRQSAEQGSAEGNFRLGLAAEKRGDLVDAQSRYEVAASLEHDTAMFALGQLNEQFSNRSAAEHWYRLASQFAHPAATRRLARLLSDKDEPS